MTLELGRVTDRKAPFKYSALARVGFSDTDAQGIVYYGRYMPFFDLARVEYTRHLGLPFNDHDGCQFVMRAASVEYHAPARFDDLLEVFVRTRRIGRTSVTTAFAVHRVDDDVLMCVAEQTLVLVDLSARRPVSIQEAYRAPVRGFEGTDLEEAAA
jgi:acyl-CoA thioester hydrolase